MDVSIIITYYNGRDHLKRCVDSALKTRGVSFEIILIDDCSTDIDETLYAQLKKHPQIQFKYMKQHAGISKCRNTGAKMAKGTYFIFQDIDAKLTPTGIQKLIEPMQNDTSIGMTQAIFYSSPDTVETSGHYFTVFGLPYNYAVVEKKPVDIFGAQGVIAARASDFRSIKGYEEDHRLNGANTDLSWRMWVSGKRIVNSPQAKTYHYKQEHEAFTERMYYRIYYSGPKTLVSMVLKNTPIAMTIWLLPMCIATWTAISIKLLLMGLPHKAVWIYKGFWWNVANFKRTMKKRKRIRSRAVEIPPSVFYGPLSALDLVKKGLSWGGSVA